MFRLDGKTALITGATGGIGGAIARRLHQQGAVVAISGTRAERLQELADELGERVFVLPCDLADGDAVSNLPAQAEEAMGQVDILVNNAAMIHDALIMRMKDEDWEQVMQVNLTASFQLARGVLRGMMKRRYGRIIGISSVVGTMGNPGQANYAASKAGLIGFTKSLAWEVSSRGITANVISPGFIDTAMTDALNDKQKQSLASRIPSGRVGEADEVATSVLFLASEEAGYITGQTLHVNGGMVMV